MDDSIVNVRQHGALGDGKTDDTEAIRQAISKLPPKGGVVFFPPGHYLTDVIYAPSFTTFKGSSAWGYQDVGGSVISPAKEFQPRLFDLNGKIATRLVGLSLHGRDMGADMAGVYTARPGQHEQNIVIDDCRIEHFSGSAIAMGEAHVWCIRHCNLFANKLDGIDASKAFDGWIIDTQIAANGRYGINVNNSVAITGNRIEHNGQGGIFFNRHYGQHVQVTGNLFCSNRGPSIEALEGNIRALAISGNTFRNSAYNLATATERDCHVRFQGVQGLTFTGNALHVLWCNNPGVGMILQGLVDSVVANNSLFKGATKELIRDLGGHRNTVIQNNPGSLKDPKDLDS